MKKFLKISAAILLSIVSITFGSLVLFINVTKDVSFDPKKLSFSCETNIYLSSIGERIKDNSSKASTPIEVKDLPPHVKNAFIAVEDKRFYSHNGIDFKRILGAALNNLKNMRFKEGASTISQQLIKNTHLSSEKTLSRKLKEIKLTFILERRYTKDEILQTYLNTIYFGGGAYGIENAAIHYFNKQAKDLSVSEAATLAAIIKAPTRYSPFKNLNEATKRRNTVLALMYDQGYITKKACNKAQNSSIELSLNNTCNEGASYLNYVKYELEEILKNEYCPYNSSLTVYTYLNEELTKIVREEIIDQLPDCNYTAIITDGVSSGVSVLVSDVGLLQRNPASTVKPWLVFAPAIEEGEINAATKILDKQTDFNGYTPSNHNGEYEGYISVKDALVKSKNVPAVKIADFMGVQRLNEYAEKMNVTVNGGLDVALGGIQPGMTLKQIADCYSPFRADGYFTESRFIKKIVSAEGKTLYEHKANKKQVFSAETAFIINDMLYECAKTGTARKTSACNLPVCAKTGTNGNKSGNFDAYTVSYTPELTLAVWYGNADYSQMQNSVSGGTYPSIASGEIWKRISQNIDIGTFKKPEGVISVNVDKEKYDNDCLIYLGDGPAFYFKKGTEPQTKVKRDSTVTKIEQQCNGGNYNLTFTLNGYDAAEIYLTENNKKRLLATSIGVFTHKLKVNTTYVFSIKPYSLKTDGAKQYGEETILRPIKYTSKEDLPPLKNFDWWEEN